MKTCNNGIMDIGCKWLYMALNTHQCFIFFVMEGQVDNRPSTNTSHMVWYEYFLNISAL